MANLHTRNAGELNFRSDLCKLADCVIVISRGVLTTDSQLYIGFAAWVSDGREG